MAARSSGASINRRSAAASAALSPAGTSRPCTPSSITSRQPGVSSTEAARPGSQPDAPASTGTYQRTVRFSAPGLGPPPHHRGSPEHASHDPHGSVHHEPAPSRSGGGLKVALAVGALLVVGVSVAAGQFHVRLGGKPKFNCPLPHFPLC